MSGHPTNTNVTVTRRYFVKAIAQAFAAPFLYHAMQSCNVPKSIDSITGGIVGANHKAGHLLRSGKFGQATKEVHCKVLIVGGGISGLSARRWLAQKGVQDVVLLEMDKQPGGNSTSGANAVSKYPWGAHYLPIPDVANKDLLDFLHAAGVITGYANDGLPIYNEYHLCHDPEERLYINGRWQAGLVPQYGISKADADEIKRFFEIVEDYRNKKGSDGKYYFTIPLDNSSADKDNRQLDTLTFKQYLDMHQFTSPYLLWYLEYCCKDDYGSQLEDTSAWAGIHYFASRKGKGANVKYGDVLTWPEGNAYLMHALKEQAKSTIINNHLVYNVAVEAGKPIAYAYDVETNKVVAYQAEHIILAGPQYVNKHLVPAYADRFKIGNYAPWMVANITLSGIPADNGEPLCWDNVIYGKPSVGYVYANHQDVSQPGAKGVITYYYPIAHSNSVKARQEAYATTYEQWKERIVKELEYAHKGITNYIEHIDVWVWGHGMISPKVDYIWGADRVAMSSAIDGVVHFAHTDLSGISIFEEAFYQGIKAAEAVLINI